MYVRCFVVFKDHYSKLKFIAFLKKKSDVVYALKDMLAKVKNQGHVGTASSITKILQVKVPEEHVVNEMKLAVYVAAHSSTMSVDHIR